MELMGIITLGAGLIMTVIVLSGYRGLAMFGVLGLPLGAIMLFYMRKARLEGLKQFEEDNSPIVAMECGDGPAAYANPGFRTFLWNSIAWVASDEARAWARQSAAAKQ